MTKESIDIKGINQLTRMYDKHTKDKNENQIRKDTEEQMTKTWIKLQKERRHVFLTDNTLMFVEEDD